MSYFSVVGNNPASRWDPLGLTEDPGGGGGETGTYVEWWILMDEWTDTEINDSTEESSDKVHVYVYHDHWYYNYKLWSWSLWWVTETSTSFVDYALILEEMSWNETYTTTYTRSPKEVSDAKSPLRFLKAGFKPTDTSTDGEVSNWSITSGSRTYRGAGDITVKLLEHALDSAVDGAKQALATVMDFGQGFREGFVEAETLGLVRAPTPDTQAQHWGQVIGSGVVSAQGIAETIGGLGMMAGGGVACLAGAVPTGGAVCVTVTPAMATGGLALSTAGVAHASAGVIVAFSKAGNGPSRDAPDLAPEKRYSGSMEPSPVKRDPAAEKLAERIGGKAQQKFSSDPDAREFDVISNEWIAQAKPANFKLGEKFRVQAKATFEAAKATGRKAYFQFEGPPQYDVISKIIEYGQRYGVEFKIDITPLF